MKIDVKFWSKKSANRNFSPQKSILQKTHFSTQMLEVLLEGYKKLAANPLFIRV